MKIILRWLPVLLWMGIIFYLSSQTEKNLKSLFPFLDQFDWGHYVAYFVLAALFFFAMNYPRKRLTKVVIVILCLFYGVTDEFHQSFVAGRTPDVFDLLNDTIGATLAMILALFWGRKKKHPASP